MALANNVGNTSGIGIKAFIAKLRVVVNAFAKKIPIVA
jgi:hypothetical protein